MDFNNLSLVALIDSRAFVNCLPESEFEKTKSISPDNVLKELKPPTFKLQVANGGIEDPTKTVQLRFEIGEWTIEETFLVATKLTGPILVLTFLKIISAILDVRQALLLPIAHTPSQQMITRQSPGTIKSQHETKKTIMPNQCATIEAGINLRTLTNTTGTTHRTEQYPGDNQIVVASSNSTTSNSKTEMRVTNTSPNPFTLKYKTTVAEFLILSPKKQNNSNH